MKVFFVVINLCLLLLHGTDGRKFRDDYSYYPEAEGWLKLHQIPANWNSAWLKCFREGAILASPETKNLNSTMRTLSANLQNSLAVYTGIHSTFSKGDYYTIEGTPLSKINVSWAPGEPDNFENKEDCLVMYHNGTFADKDCNGVYPFLCYKKKTRLISNACGTTDPGYTLNIKTGSCYKFHRSPQNWTQAFAACSGEGGHLAIINDNVEATAIRDLYGKYPDSAMPGNFEKQMAHIGVTDWGQQGLWVTIHGETLKDAGYDSWMNGYPSVDSTGIFNRPCGTVFRDGRLANTRCERVRPFICEKTPDSLEEVDYYE
ncbi:hemolymph lipopolysaccharide-binding protein-like [Leguminivora glycinivorella]|uniref:hemolymph lipopolysaccharide-binding protein-like n=1 Tax=Leguminivora glycinivorella TaxID=1035111 RepID=UPI002010B183|nr:hemolymph lipopolysaccharide-binding protein-like [Leguminivora glycinivorella]